MMQLTGSEKDALRNIVIEMLTYSETTQGNPVIIEPLVYFSGVERGTLQKLLEAIETKSGVTWS